MIDDFYFVLRRGLDIKVLDRIEATNGLDDFYVDGWRHVETINAKEFIKHRLKLEYEVGARLNDLLDVVETNRNS